MASLRDENHQIDAIPTFLGEAGPVIRKTELPEKGIPLSLRAPCTPHTRYFVPDACSDKFRWHFFGHLFSKSGDAP